MKKAAGNTVAAIAAGAVASLIAFGAAAQTWPDRTITIVVPFAAGGGADPVARTVAEGLQQAFGKPVVVDFRPGANGTIGAKIVAEAAPDGYTLLVTSQAPLVNVRFSKNVPYDPDKDLVPIAQLADAPYLLVASGKFGPSTLQELIEHAKQHPGDVNAGVSGLGGLSHLATVIFQEATGTELTPIPYDGVGERIADLMAGNIDISTGIGASGFLAGIQDGSIKPIAVLGETRLPELPDVQTSIELGYPEAVVSGWYVMAAPTGVSEEIIEKVNHAVVEYLNRPEVKERFIKFGNMVKTSSPGEAKALIDGESGVIKKIIDEGKFTIQ
ncbi:Bug family tripartite tricarboxylate transporter substrate binding protein [Faunimonas sp. B44]|uniref:Bug family tripartite tricarboxylate transporter substrate binding protein n=1 Tax=Faunimonas sp. B44 TaxID=3461493 RepID=UPI00404460AF